MSDTVDAAVIAAADRKDALTRLKERNLTVIELKEKKAGGQITFARRKKINNNDTYYMARELATLLRSGMQIDKAVEILIHSADKQEMKEMLGDPLRRLPGCCGACRWSASSATGPTGCNRST